LSYPGDTKHDEWLTKNESAAYAKLTTRTLDRYIETGALPASRIGLRQIRIRRSDLDALMKPIAAGGDR